MTKLKSGTTLRSASRCSSTSGKSFCSAARVLISWAGRRIIRAFQTCLAQEISQCALAGGPALLSSDISVAIDSDIDGIRLRGKHRGKVSVLGEHDSTTAGTALQVLLDPLLRLIHVNGQDDQALGGKFLVDVIHHLLLPAAILAPRGPELQQNNFPLKGIIVEFFAAQRLGREPGRRFTRVRGS